MASSLVEPPFDQLGDVAQLIDWPWDDALAVLNAQAQARLPGGLGFVEQTPALVADDLSYEQRIGERGQVAMRRDSLHDLYGALMWLRWPQSKWSIHQGQMAGVRAHGARQRSRHQQALTHIDEAGLVVVTPDRGLIDALHGHDWTGLLGARRGDWSRAQVRVIGHALFELRRTQPHDLLAGKVIALLAPAGTPQDTVDDWVAQALADGRAAADPKDLPTLPLAAIPGWDPRNTEPAFIASAPCFRPRPAGRVYAPPLLPPTTHNPQPTTLGSG
ncbi:MAG: DUF3025 domain-containing protein [Rhodanobacteraceae bacterium]|nr:DUF3025 domain-containing protein [Rhodanobacteraceae bacterium]